MLLAGCGDRPDPLSEGPPGAAPADGVARIAELTAQRAVLAGKLALAESGAEPESEPGAGADARAAAERVGVDPEWAARVLADQIAAGEQVRDGLLRQWTEQPATRSAERPDPAQLRSDLDRIDDELIAVLRIAAPARTHEDCPGSLAQAAVARAEGIDDLHRAALGRGLMSICDGTPD